MASKRATGGPASVNKSHKSFQPILPCGNKLLQQKWDQTYYNEHRKLVKAAKPMVDTGAPPKRPHVTKKWKKQQIEKERSEEIERDNLNLLKKMQHIMDTEGAGIDHHNTYQHHSLNHLQRKRELERVARENGELVKRLEKVEPIYKLTDWVDDWEKNEKLHEMITCYPESMHVKVMEKDSKSDVKENNQEAVEKKETQQDSEVKVSAEKEEETHAPKQDTGMSEAKK